MAIMHDMTLTDDEKARARQQLMMGGWSKPAEKLAPAGKGTSGANNYQRSFSEHGEADFGCS